MPVIGAADPARIKGRSRCQLVGMRVGKASCRPGTEVPRREGRRLRSDSG